MAEQNIIYYGDIDIKASVDNGPGDLRVSSKAILQGNVDSTSHTDGTLIVTGGAGISGKIFGNSSLDISGLTTLQGTSIDLATDNFTASGANNIVFTPASFQLTSTAASSLTTSAGDITVNPAGTLNLGGAAISAISDSFTLATDTINIDSVSTTISNNTTLAAQNFILELTGATDSKLSLQSSGTGASALELTTSAGGIIANATGALSLQSSTSVSIGTTANVPITIGSGISTVTVSDDLTVVGDTTISGNLTVSGTTTTLNTETLIFEDNIVVYNSAPGGIADGGMAVKRWQTVDGLTNDVLSDAPNETSVGHSGTVSGSTATTFVMGSGASAINDYYNGWWVEIVATGQVRRIRDYDGTTKVATIYGTGEIDASYPGSPLDFVTPASNDGSAYNLYGNNFIASVYREGTDTWALFTVPLEPAIDSQLTPLKYINLEAGDITSYGTVFTNTVSATTGTAVTISGVTVDTGALTGVSSINGSTPDSVDTVVLADNTVAVEIPSSEIIGSFILLVESSTPGGSMAQFSACKALSADNVSPNRIALARGSNNERVSCIWNAGEKLKLLFQNTPGTASTYTYSVKIMSV